MVVASRCYPRNTLLLHFSARYNYNDDHYNYSLLLYLPILTLLSHVTCNIMPDSMPGAFFLDSPAPPKLDLVGASSQVFQVPQTPSASSSLYRSISSRKRPRREADKSTLFDPQSVPVSSAPSDADCPLVEGSQHAEFDCRPNRYRESRLPSAVDDGVESLAPNEASGNARKRSRPESPFSTPYGSHGSIPHQPIPGASWGRTVIDMVGKVWDFCWSGTFGGFYAGGGQGYSMNPVPSQLGDTLCQSTYIKKDDVFTATSSGRDAASIPGQFPDADIQRNWVVIPEDDRDIFVDAVNLPSPTRRANRKNVSPLHLQRRRAMASQLGRRAHTPSTPTKIRPMSPRHPQSPSSAETQRHVAQIRRRERQEDASLRRLNLQLETMIQEGQAALGTKVEVDDMDMED